MNKKFNYFDKSFIDSTKEMLKQRLETDSPVDTHVFWFSVVFDEILRLPMKNIDELGLNL
jgi:hypothetical protein